MEIFEEIELLKTKIYLELNSLKYHEEFSNIIGNLEKKFLRLETVFCNKKNNNYLDEVFILAYKSFLESFIEVEIEGINKVIAQGKDNAYDNRSPELLEKVQGYEEEIEEVISYLKEKLPFMSDVIEKYQKLKDKYYSKLDDSFKYNKTSFYQLLGVRKSICLSLCGSSSSLFKRYLCDLEIFKNEYIDRLKILIDNDVKIRDTIARAKYTFRESNAIEAFNQLEANYLEFLQKCMGDFVGFKEENVKKLQQEMLNRVHHLEELIKERKTLEEYSNYLNRITFLNYDIDKLLEIEKYVNENDALENDFYEIMYFIVEKDKRVKGKKGIDFRIYDKLSSETKIKLEKMFVDRLSLLGENKIKEVLQEYKSKGFVGVKDSTLDDFFENVKIKYLPTIEFDVTKVGPSKRIEWYDTAKIAEIKLKIIEKNPKYKMLPKKCSLTQIGEKCFCMKVGTKEPYRYFYFDGDFNKLDVPDDKEININIFNFYIGELNDVLHLYDNYFNVIYKSDTKCKLWWVGYCNPNEFFLAFREKYDFEEHIIILDKDGKLLYKASLKDVINQSGKEYDLRYSNFDTTSYNDGIIIAELKTDEESEKDFYRFNMSTNKIIDGGSSGRRLFKNDRSGLLGFKDYDGNVVIEPKFRDATEFVGNLAIVEENRYNPNYINQFIDISGCHYNFIIDIFGKVMSHEMLKIPNNFEKIYADYKSDRIVIIKNGREFSSFRAKNDFRIFIPDESKRHISMLEYIRNNEHVKTLVKQ